MTKGLPPTIEKIECVLPARFRLPAPGVRSKNLQSQGIKHAVSWGPIATVKITVSSFEPTRFKLVPFPKRNIDAEVTVKYVGKKKAVFSFTGPDVNQTLIEISSKVSPRPLRKKKPAIQSPHPLRDLVQQFTDYIMQLDG